VAPAAQIEARFLIALFGPTVVSAAFNRPSAAGWWWMILAVLLWAPYDSFLSLQERLYANLWANLAVSIAVVVPLFIVRKYFFFPPRSNSPSR